MTAIYSGYENEIGSVVKQRRLEIALDEAMKWQRDLVGQDEQTVAGHTYYGPHKWIVCLIGSDAYTVSNFER